MGKKVDSIIVRDWRKIRPLLITAIRLSIALIFIIGSFLYYFWVLFFAYDGIKFLNFIVIWLITVWIIIVLFKEK